MRYTFWKVFKKNANGSLSPIRLIRFGGVTIGKSIAFSQGVSFLGVDVFAYLESDLEAEMDGDVLVIKGFYKKQ